MILLKSIWEVLKQGTKFIHAIEDNKAKDKEIKRLRLRIRKLEKSIK